MTLTPAPHLDVRLAPGRAAFNRGEFFAAHELWEDVWRELAGDDRVLVQGLIQIAAGLHHARNGRTGPAARLLARGTTKLARGARAQTTLPIGALIRDVERLQAALATPGETLDLGAIRF